LRSLSALLTAHCGCTPPREYEGLPQTGQAGGFCTTMLGLEMLAMTSSRPRRKKTGVALHGTVQRHAGLTW
jgi:hypothetical protein